MLLEIQALEHVLWRFLAEWKLFLDKVIASRVSFLLFECMSWIILVVDTLAQLFFLVGVILTFSLSENGVQVLLLLYCLLFVLQTTYMHHWRALISWGRFVFLVNQDLELSWNFSRIIIKLRKCNVMLRFLKSTRIFLNRAFKELFCLYINSLVFLFRVVIFFDRADRIMRHLKEARLISRLLCFLNKVLISVYLTLIFKHFWKTLLLIHFNFLTVSLRGKAVWSATN